MHRLAHRHTAALELDVDHGHAVDEQAHIAAAAVEQLALGAIPRLLGNLITALTCSDLVSVIYLQAHLFAQVCLVIGVVALDGDRLPVDEGVERKRGLEHFDLLDDLRHLARSKRATVEAILADIVLVQDVRPILDEVVLGGILQHAPGIIPSMLLEHGNQSLFEIRLALEYHGLCPSASTPS